MASDSTRPPTRTRSEEHTSELQSLRHLVCRLLLEKKKKRKTTTSLQSPHEPPGPPPTRRPAPHQRLVGAEVRARRYGRLKTLRSFDFFNDTATTEIYTLSLHDALPIY